MSNVLQTPDFKSEEEEALWWYQNQDLVLAEFEQAAKEGTLAGGHSQPGVRSPKAAAAQPELKRTA